MTMRTQERDPYLVSVRAMVDATRDERGLPRVRLVVARLLPSGDLGAVAWCPRTGEVWTLPDNLGGML